MHRSPEGAGPLTAAWPAISDPQQLVETLDDARDRLARAWSTPPATLPGELAAAARADLSTSWPRPLARHFRRYHATGERMPYEQRVRDLQARLTRAAVMAWAGSESGTPDSSDGGWLDEVADGVYLLCELSTWAWVAHDDAHEASGAVLPDTDRPYLDLGAGEIAAQLAWIDLLLGDALDQQVPGLRARMRLETRRRAVDPFLERLDWHWLGLDGDVHNWNPWIHGNLLTAALLMEPDRERRARIVARVIEGLDRYLAWLPADGAVDEGFSYWWDGAGRCLEALELLEQASGGRLVADVPVLRSTLAFPRRLHLGGAFFVNAGDGAARAKDSIVWEVLLPWARRFGDAATAAHAEAMAAAAPAAPPSSAGIHRVLRRLATRAASAPHNAPAPADGWDRIDSAQIAVARASGVAASLKGGHNGEHHNHLDLGSVIVAVDGVPLVVDAGQPTYTAETFGPNRYRARAMQSLWHSTPAPGGLMQGIGSRYTARGAHAASAAASRESLELAGAYDLPAGSSWLRSLTVDPDGRVEVIDEWEIPGGTAETTCVHLLLAGTVERHDGGARVSPRGIPGTGGGRSLRLHWPSGAAAQFEDWELEDPLLAAVWGERLTRLTLDAGTDARSHGRLRVSMEAQP
ncbi:heparinase II/III domain-containing protein [Zhihengliuella halotolerans]|uniref:Heparinase II/III-like protein n=1 Tax=Zhihengliuella halotolerans TaxID=370736 RepID=A0A4Q8AFW9_9MICC|nr:heparinase II/III family protein [Zhihengliuella halotolerans]RZU62539.1 heparinase II/III-like protein [Zhihengliuella halotolerans]